MLKRSHVRPVSSQYTCFLSHLVTVGVIERGPRTDACGAVFVHNGEERRLPELRSTSTMSPLRPSMRRVATHFAPSQKSCVIAKAYTKACTYGWHRAFGEAYASLIYELSKLKKNKLLRKCACCMQEAGRGQGLPQGTALWQAPRIVCERHSSNGRNTSVSAPSSPALANLVRLHDSILFLFFISTFFFSTTCFMPPACHSVDAARVLRDDKPARNQPGAVMQMHTNWVACFHVICNRRGCACWCLEHGVA